ncbi:FmdB family zinc ribbon protein [Paraburkholderia sp. SIMBA_030]|uniref:FmdB family zinc ribbon protein n=1 Tax=Paraburkholderia sp. SIMBA_030 TaxID=3085773 RepID=UPI00397DBEC2
MPIYDFQCEGCGPFAVMRSIAERDRPGQCPECGAVASRMVSAPALALMSGTQRTAHAGNERAAHAPRHSSEVPARHRPGCGCCSGGKLSLAGASGGTKSNGLKSASGGGRPWMISH